MTHPTDIDWGMISARGKSPLHKRLLLNLVIVAILIFVTTPASLLNLVSWSKSLKRALSLEWVNQQSAFSQFVFKGLLPSIIIALINELILWIISIVAELERHHRFSWRHRSEHRKVFIYLFLNMIIVPGFGAAAFTNLYDIFSQGYENTLDFLKQLFELSNGNFFLIFVINNAGGTFWAQINCSSLMFKNYLSPTLAMITKLY